MAFVCPWTNSSCSQRDSSRITLHSFLPSTAGSRFAAVRCSCTSKSHIGATRGARSATTGAPIRSISAPLTSSNATEPSAGKALCGVPPPLQHRLPAHPLASCAITSAIMICQQARIMSPRECPTSSSSSPRGRLLVCSNRSAVFCLIWPRNASVSQIFPTISLLIDEGANYSAIAFPSPGHR